MIRDSATTVASVLGPSQPEALCLRRFEACSYARRHERLPIGGAHSAPSRGSQTRRSQLNREGLTPLSTEASVENFRASLALAVFVRSPLRRGAVLSAE